VFVILLLFSIDAVPPLFLGIKYNNFNKAAQVDDIKTPGRYFILPWNRFLLFPSNVQTITFSNEPLLNRNALRFESLSTRTSEGLALRLQVSFQYRLKPDVLGQTYSTLNLNYRDFFASQARDALLRAASQFEAVELWRNRAEFQTSLEDVVGQELSRFATCWGLQLLRIDLTDSYENAIVNTQVQEQTKNVRTQEQMATRIRAETEVFRAEYDRQARVIMAQGNANYTVVTRSAAAEAQRRSMMIESTVFQSVRTRLGISGSGLVEYQKYTSLPDLPDSMVYYNW
jgi:regulator of protease activity HflC (stomatin/prohibitin superfamily)